MQSASSMVWIEQRRDIPFCTGEREKVLYIYMAGKHALGVVIYLYRLTTASRDERRVRLKTASFSRCLTIAKLDLPRARALDCMFHACVQRAVSMQIIRLCELDYPSASVDLVCIQLLALNLHAFMSVFFSMCSTRIEWNFVGKFNVSSIYWCDTAIARRIYRFWVTDLSGAVANTYLTYRNMWRAATILYFPAVTGCFHHILR